MLNSGWFDSSLREYLAPNLVAEAAKDFAVADDRVRLAAAPAALCEGRQVGDWEVSTEAAVAVAPGLLNASDLLHRARAPEIEARARAATAEFYALGVSHRPTFVLENFTGDRVVVSGLAKDRRGRRAPSRRGRSDRLRRAPRRSATRLSDGIVAGLAGWYFAGCPRTFSATTSAAAAATR